MVSTDHELSLMTLKARTTTTTLKEEAHVRGCVMMQQQVYLKVRLFLSFSLTSILRFNKLTLEAK